MTTADKELLAALNANDPRAFIARHYGIPLGCVTHAMVAMERAAGRAIEGLDMTSAEDCIRQCLEAIGRWNAANDRVIAACEEYEDLSTGTDDRQSPEDGVQVGPYTGMEGSEDHEDVMEDDGYEPTDEDWEWLRVRSLANGWS